MDRDRRTRLVVVASFASLVACGTNSPPPSHVENASGATGLGTDAGGVERAGDVQVGTITLTAPNTDGERVVGRLLPQFRSCYLKGLATTPTMSGEVTLTIRIGPDGDVESAVARDIRGLPPEVVACMTTAARGAFFAAPSGGGATVFVPLRCIPNDRTRRRQARPLRSVRRQRDDQRDHRRRARAAIRSRTNQRELGCALDVDGSFAVSLPYDRMNELLFVRHLGFLFDEIDACVHHAGDHGWAQIADDNGIRVTVIENAPGG
jgi:hypothetical protein